MRIERLALKNFKCFKEVDVSFSKITLLTGENSSGKSSLIYGILAPLQSINTERLYYSFPLYISLNGNYVSMGGFEEVSFNHDLKSAFTIDLDLSLDESSIIRLNSSWFFDIQTKSTKLNYLKTEDGFKHAEVKQLEDFSYLVNFERVNLKTNLPSLDAVNSLANVLEGIADVELLEQSENSLYLVNINYINTKDLIIQNLDELIGIENNLQRHFSEMFINSDVNDNFSYISSFRFQPDRTYYQSLASSKVDKFGGGYIDQILEWNDNQSDKLFELVSILKDLKILYDVKTHKLSGGRFEIKVKVKSRNKWESLADVGFGTSQFLPIIVADLQLSDDSTLIMSQPEIHLHPSVQANLGNYLVKQVNERNKNYIVETHSEYLLNRMRLLIVKGDIQPEDVAVYYFENSIKNGSIAHRIEFTKDGQILNAPKGFFETYMIDTMDIALNA
jgi:predicted ATPase